MSTDTIEVFHDQPMLVGESPLWSARENALYWIDIPRRMIHCKNVDSLEHGFWSLPSEPGCIALDEAGGLIVAMRSGIASFDPIDGRLSMLSDAPYDTRTMRFNDGRCDRNGRLWVGSMYEPRDKPQGTLYSLERGFLCEHPSPVTVSNGLAFGPDGKTMYQADTTAHEVYRFNFDLEHGKFSDKHVFRSFSVERSEPGYGGRPDGAAVDSEGAYWVAMYEGARLLRFSNDGSLLQEVPLPVKCPTMPAFGGSDLRTIFISTASQTRSEDELKAMPLSGCILKLRVSVPGLPEPAYRH